MLARPRQHRNSDALREAPWQRKRPTGDLPMGLLYSFNARSLTDGTARTWEARATRVAAQGADQQLVVLEVAALALLRLLLVVQVALLPSLEQRVTGYVRYL